MGAVGKIGFKVISMAIAIPSGIAVKKALNKGWERSRGTEPPTDPRSRDNDWLEIIAWAAVSGTIVAGAQAAASHGAAKTYRFLTGQEPPADVSKEDKEKAKKA